MQFMPRSVYYQCKVGRNWPAEDNPGWSSDSQLLKRGYTPHIQAIDHVLWWWRPQWDDEEFLNDPRQSSTIQFNLEDYDIKQGWGWDFVVSPKAPLGQPLTDRRY